MQRWNDSLYAQCKLLERKLEYQLLGNHLLEDAYALFIASIYFSDKKMYDKASCLLYKELDEQILPDGSHYEQSPMYHCICSIGYWIAIMPRLIEVMRKCVSF